MPEMTAEQMRHRIDLIAQMDDWAARRRELILDLLRAGLTLEDIAEHAHESLVDVLTPFSRNPVAMAFNIIDGNEEAER